MPKSFFIRKLILNIVLILKIYQIKLNKMKVQDLKKGQKVRYNGSGVIGLITFVKKRNIICFEVRFNQYVSHIYKQEDIDNEKIEILND